MKFIKIGPQRLLLLPDDATDWVAVLDNRTSLMWTVKEMDRMNWGKAQAAVGALDIAGYSDWRLPTVDEGWILADRTRYTPAIDTDFFPDCRSEWYWTSTPYASPPHVCAWVVDFSDGNGFWGHRDGDHCVRAVRSV